MKIISLSEEDWNQQIQGVSPLTPFHQVSWHRVLKSTFKDLAVEYYAIEQSGKATSLIPIFKRKRFGLKLMGSPLRGMFTSYLGPLSENGTEMDADEMLNRLFRVLSPDFFELASAPKHSLVIDGACPSETILVDLAPGEAELWKKMKKKTRNQVRQAQKAGVEIVGPETNDDWILEYYDMLSDTYRRRDMTPPTSIDFYRKLWQQLSPIGLLTVLMARFEGRIIAGGIYLVCDGAVYGLDGAMDRRYQKQRPNNLIEWETIAWGANQGLRCYDMLGANIPSIAKFKLGFGGQLESYDKLERFPSLVGRLGFAFYQRFKPGLKKFFRI